MMNRICILCILLAAEMIAADIFEKPFRVLADGKPISVTTQHAAPHLRDMDGDGVRDLLVGEFGSERFTGEVSEKGGKAGGWLVLLKHGDTILDKKASSKTYLSENWMAQSLTEAPKK